MKLKLRRRSVYIGTIVAMVAMVGGFALAGATSLIIGAPSTGYGTGSGSVVNSGTIYTTNVATAYSDTSGASGTCSSATPAAFTATPQTLYYGSGQTGSGTCGAADEFLVLTLTTSSLTASTTYTDDFAIAVSPGGSAIDFTVVWDLTLGPQAATLHVALDIGTATATSVTISVNGS
jgi:hypothetical protein